MNNNSFGRGFLFTFLSYFLWGILPLYWHLLLSIDPLHILSFRILFSLVMVGTILLAIKNHAWLKVFREPKKMFLLIITAIFLSSNWGIYIWAVNRGHTLEASLGYYINPLFSVILGLVFYRERLLPLQWAAVAIAFAGVTFLTVLSGSIPWIPLALAFTFGVYGLLKKKSPLSALESLGAETLASVPISLFLLFFSFRGNNSELLHPAFSGLNGLAYLTNLSAHVWILLALIGIVSALPLYFFAFGAKLLPLSTLGFIQFVSPTIQFIVGLFVFGETFPPHHFAAFTIIWIAVILYIFSLRSAPANKNEHCQ